MRSALTIARRDISSSFYTPLAYVVGAGFMFLTGFFFFNILQDFNVSAQQATLTSDVAPNLNDFVVTRYFQIIDIVLIFLLPVLTMRALAEERRGGTFELLITSPISITDIILGKFFALSFVITCMLFLSFVFPMVLIFVSDPEVAPILVGCGGMLLFSYAFVALGIAVSAATKSQTMAGVISLVLFLVFFLIDTPAEKMEGLPAAILRYLSPASHGNAFFQGVIQGSDLIFFLSITAFGLFFAHRVLEAVRWR